MKLYMRAMTIAIGCMMLSALFAADNKKIVYVNTIKTSFEISFSDDTTVYQLKNAIQDWEGIPVNQQLLQKKEWVRGQWLIPQCMAIELEDNQTCSSYGLQNKDNIYLYLTLIRRSSKDATAHVAE